MKKATESNSREPEDIVMNPRLRFLWLLVLCVFTLWMGSYYAVSRLFGAPDGAGTFGDMFGAVNALFSGLAFVGLVYAILLQRRELELQRRELAATRTEYRRSASAQEVSARLVALNTLIEHDRKMVEKLRQKESALSQNFSRGSTEIQLHMVREELKILEGKLDDHLNELETTYQSARSALDDPLSDKRL